ncbi:MAG: SusC/RagA family TonB-linked outer membrane protein [Dysgonamonadaceae bacterium]|jgi:TonB-linked SusC/RagA family outer membrane protein|nr:SusC/RagA family TonB-linked outer membrane protein [Dysgonamonadaceae bacterium]
MKYRLYVVSLFLFISAAAFAQNIKVSGVIISAEDKEPIIGASVTVKDNTSIGTVTDLDGNFSLTVPAGSKTLVISYIGMKTLEVPMKERIEAVMQPDDQMLGEVVVTGMQRVDKRLFTGATSKIDAGQAKLDGVADISRSLEGRAAGVSVQNVSGTFGTAPKIRVRGATSIYGSSKPLWVVDGVVMEDAVDVSADQLSSGDAATLISSAIAGLNADDIADFQILKDGSATSIYGARAMAGVIVVTTKSGQSGSTKINYTGEFSFRMKPNYSNFNILNSQEQMGIYKEMKDKGWLEAATISNNSNSGIYGKMYQLIATYNETAGKFGLENSDWAKNTYLQEAEFRNTDWFDLLFHNTITQNHAVSVSGGSDKSRYYASLSVMEDPGWTNVSSIERYTANVNASFDLSKNLTLKLLTNDSFRKQLAPGTLNQEVDVVFGEVKRSFDINPYSYAMNTSRTLDANTFYTRNYSPFNILHELDNNNIELNIADLKFQGQLDWKIIKGLDVSALVAARYQQTSHEHFVKDQSNQALAYRAGIDPANAIIRDANPYLYTDPADPNALPETVLDEGGIYFRNDYKMKQIDFKLVANFNRSFGSEDQHIVGAFGGIESNSTDKNKVNFQGWGFNYENGGIPSINPLLFKQQNEENASYYSNKWTYDRSFAEYLQVTYSYKGKYVLSGTGRYEGTNKLGKSRQSRWLPTYNISGAWNVHEESWFNTSQKTLSHLMLKASYSLTGDRGPADVSNAEAIYYAYSPWRPLYGVKETGLKEEYPANEELTYEKKYEYNVGAEIGFFNNRINLALDVYTRDNFDLIGDVYTEGAGGFILKKANVANMKSKGLEGMLSTKNVVTRDFSWSSSFTYSWINNKITHLDSRANMMSLISGNGFALEGYPVRALFSIPFVGLNDEGLPVFINEKGEETVSDINLQEQDPKKLGFLIYEGPTDPTTSGGFENTFTYKGFRLNLFITYAFGNKVRLDPVFSNKYSDLVALPKEYKNRWTLPGDEQYTQIPVIANRIQDAQDTRLKTAYSAYNYSNVRIADGGFIRMKDISLSYDFDKKVLELFKVSNFQLKIQATNLFLLYADKKLNGQDPEFVNSGGVASPMPRQFTLTLRLGI